MLRSSALVFASAAWLAVLAPLAGVAAQTAPEPAPAEPSPELRERARGAYQAGQRAFNTGHYEDAASSFQAAFDAIPNPVVLLSLAESRLRAGQLAEAIATFEQYLELRPDAADRVTIEQRIELLAAKPGFVAITSDPSDADVELDGSPMFRTPVQLELKPGAHEIRCTRPGYAPRTYPVTATPGSRQTLHCQLDVLPPTPRVAPLDSAFVRELPSGRPMTAIWITGGIGVAGVLSTAVFGALAVSANADYRDKPTRAAADRGERYGVIADLSLGVGVVGLATAATLYLLSDDPPCASATSTPAIRF
jgi:tetratricopeptide (TPR) repeat protein